VVTTLCVLVLTGCKADNTTPCGDQTCRSGFSCDTIHDVCVVPAQLEVCVGEADGSECAINGTYGYVCDQEVCLPSECGDGILDVHSGEQCDDGNHIDDDACPNNCTLNCGDGTVNPGEECDGNDLDGETCGTRGFDTGQLTCELNCTFDESQCAVDCGNGTVHSTEGCDDDNTTSGDGCSDTCDVEGGWECQGEPSVCTTIPYNALSGGGAHVCALRSDDTTLCWGFNSHGQLGDGTQQSQFVPTEMNGLPGIVAISAGGYHTCAILSDGTLWCWGSNAYGQLGDGTTTDSLTPVQVADLTGVTSVSAGGGHTCAVKSDGTAWCWGKNFHGQLGNLTTTGEDVPNPDPVQVDSMSGASIIKVGAEHTCVIKSDATVWCWGWNNQGQVGDNSISPAETSPRQVVNLPTAVDIDLGFGHTCALRSNGEVLCWGWNLAGQLGNGSSVSFSQTPVLADVTNATAIVSGFAHSCAVLSNGTAWCWGWNWYGQLGNSTTTGEFDANPDPVQVNNMTDAVLVSTKGEYTCATRVDGTVWCWGRNVVGQLGNENGLNSSVPVAVAIR